MHPEQVDEKLFYIPASSIDPFGLMLWFDDEKLFYIPVSTLMRRRQRLWFDDEKLFYIPNCCFKGDPPVLWFDDEKLFYIPSTKSKQYASGCGLMTRSSFTYPLKQAQAANIVVV